MGEPRDKAGLTAVAAAAEAARKGGAADLRRPRGLPPVRQWTPARVGEIDIVIRRDGSWVHEGGVIGREAMVRLFASILRKDPDGIYLVTPQEKLKIRVEDAPFVAVRLDRAGPALRFTTNVGDEVEAGPDHPIRLARDAAGELRPYLHVRDGLEALIARPVFYELAELAETRETPRGREFGVASNGVWFALGPAEADGR